ncbi:NAD synthetase [Serratia rubidaea]|uniref:NAD synthetase n=1 Tax=Serratia rubidaea TaxID=61652 RepID=A0A3S4G9T5_SERRU|nr:NAD synthetase [Serratia rubidaea]
MSRSLSIALAQLNLLVGDIEGNSERMLQIVQEQQKAGADLVMFTELALSGYPPEDLLYRDDFYQRCDVQLGRLQQASGDVAILVGTRGAKRANCTMPCRCLRKVNCRRATSSSSCPTTAFLMKSATSMKAMPAASLS